MQRNPKRNNKRMKTKHTILMLFILCLGVTACKERSVKLLVSNPSNSTVQQRLASIDSQLLQQQLQLKTGESFRLINPAGEEVPYQITFDKQLIFPINLATKATTTLQAIIGKPMAVDTLACGRAYPWRADDIAWENDLCGYRVYGPALQRKGERAFGYDVWVKRATHKPVVDQRYQMARRKKGSFHDDHGNGMDMYIVGPSLGAGAPAILLGDSLAMPYCYKSFRILDNGPLRFTLELTFHTTKVAGQALTEVRTIRANAGSYMNETEVQYIGATHKMQVVSGIVTHNDKGVLSLNDATAVAYADPAGHLGKDGNIYVGVIAPKGKRAYYQKNLAPKTGKFPIYGHVLVQSDYNPGDTYTYYWGAGWEKGWIENAEAWKKKMQEEEDLIHHPLKVEIK
jgi:hypothetical protein